MSQEIVDKLIETVVETYVTDGNALKGAIEFSQFTSEDVDLLVDQDEMSSSPAVAGSKTYLSGALFGSVLALNMISEEHTNIDESEIVAANNSAIETSLAQGIADTKARAFDQINNDSEN